MRAVLVCIAATFHLSTVALKANEPLARVPFELHAGLVFTDVTVNGKVLRVVIDSGAARVALDDKAATSAGVHFDIEAQQSGANTTVNQVVHVAPDVSYGIGGATFQEPLTVVYSFDFIAKRIGHPMPGALGGRLFRDFVVELDYPKREMRIHRPGDFQPPAASKALPLTVTPDDLQVKAEVGLGAGLGKVEGDFTLDTGAAGASVVLWKPCAGPQVESALKNGKSVESTAFGGTRAALEGTLDGLRIGDLVIPNPEVRVTDVYVTGQPSSRTCGNIGSGVFERFNVIFDVPHKRLFLVE
jgi:hypothetical protein